MKSKKQMRNIFVQRIENYLIQYYKEINFNLLNAPENEETYRVGEEYRARAMEYIDLMEELELVNKSEYLLLREVYQEYFSLHQR